MKEFNLTKALLGAPVCTRSGYEARIICFDRKGTDYPILALVGENDEEIKTYTNKGEFNKGEKGSLDLVMAPNRKWVNLYKDNSTQEIITGGVTYNTKEIARLNYELPTGAYTKIAVIPIEWEEDEEIEEDNDEMAD